MTVANLAVWAQIFSSVAILATLVYLAVEVKQNTLASHAVSRQAMFDGLHRELYKVIDNPDIAFAIGDLKEDLSDEEKMRVYHFYAAAMRAREFGWFQYQSGVVDRDAWESYQKIIMIVLGTDRGKRWWENYKIYMDEKFVECVDQILRKEPPNEYWKDVLKLS